MTVWQIKNKIGEIKHKSEFFDIFFSNFFCYDSVIRDKQTFNLSFSKIEIDLKTIVFLFLPVLLQLFSHNTFVSEKRYYKVTDAPLFCNTSFLFFVE